MKSNLEKVIRLDEKVKRENWKPRLDFFKDQSKELKKKIKNENSGSDDDKRALKILGDMKW